MEALCNSYSLGSRFGQDSKISNSLHICRVYISLNSKVPISWAKNKTLLLQQWDHFACILQDSLYCCIVICESQRTPLSCTKLTTSILQQILNSGQLAKLYANNNLDMNLSTSSVRLFTRTVQLNQWAFISIILASF